MTSLLEQLKKANQAKSTTNEPATIKQGMPSVEETQEVLLAKLKRLQEQGDKKEVNTPAEEEVEAKDEEAKTVEEVVAKAFDPKDKAVDEECPKCKKRFKDISKHKCRFGIDRKKLEEKKAEEKKTEEKKPEPRAVKNAVLEEAVNQKLDTNKPPTDKDGGYTLLIDCVPTKDVDNVILFTNVILPLCEKVAQEFQVPAWNAIKYNPGPGLLSRYFRMYVADGHLKGKILQASSLTPEFKACMSVAIAGATQVIYGV